MYTFLLNDFTLLLVIAQLLFGKFSDPMIDWSSTSAHILMIYLQSMHSKREYQAERAVDSQVCSSAGFNFVTMATSVDGAPPLNPCCVEVST